MSDEQLRKRTVIKRILMASVAMVLIAAALFYYSMTMAPEYKRYLSEKSQETNVQAQIEGAQQQNTQLLATIEENGKQLVSFSEDRIKYINLASDLSKDHSVRINKLSVSDVWSEGEMAGMTTSIEIEGSLSNIRSFIEEYCSTNYTNRINVVSCRPNGRYAWLDRSIDGDKVLSWFDLSEDQALYEDLERIAQREAIKHLTEAGMVYNPDSGAVEDYTYDSETGEFYDNQTGATLTQEELDSTPITLEKMFAEQSMKIYLVIDFLGRA